MTDHMYTLPVYRRVLQFAYMHSRDWNEAKLTGNRTWAGNVLPRVNLGAGTGKTTAALDFANSFSDVVLITANQSNADNLTRRNPGIRAFGPDHLDKLAPHNFQSTQPLFIMDDVPGDKALDLLVKFQPTRFIHLGVWG